MMTDGARQSGALKAGAAAAIVGGLGAILFNLLHPRSTDSINDPVAELRLAAESGSWLIVHVGIMIAAVVSFWGMWAVARSITGGVAESWARIAFASAVLGTAVLMVVLALDGPAAKAIADRWADANPQTQPVYLAAALAAQDITLSLLSVTLITLFGATPLLFAAAFLNSGVYPAWLGWTSVIAGALGVLSGLLQAFGGASMLATYVLFPASSLLLTVVLVAAGVVLWRRLSQPATTPPAVARV